MTDKRLIELFKLLFGMMADYPTKRVCKALSIVYQELKDRGYDFR